MSTASLSGQVVLVVGGGRGLGRRYCLDLAAAGAQVMVTGRSATVSDVVDEIRSTGGTAHAVISDSREGAGIVGATTAAFGRIDAMVYNAGIVRDRSFANMSDAEWDEVVDVHLRGSYACAKAAWQPMRSQGGGSILFTTSGAGFHGGFGQANYAAAKAGILGLTRSLAIEGAKLGIRVNAIAPIASTDMTASVFSDALKSGLPAEAVSPFAIALLDPRSVLTGVIMETGGGWASAMRWQRSLGRRLQTPDPTSAFAALADIIDFTRGSDYPSSTADSLAAAMDGARDSRNPCDVL
ncbi:MAG: SDR family NAD(P)-dependent oxidoreductase [Sphingobium sp.]